MDIVVLFNEGGYVEVLEIEMVWVEVGGVVIR